jgi:hypothetical protein
VLVDESGLVAGGSFGWGDVAESLVALGDVRIISEVGAQPVTGAMEKFV